MEKTKLSYFVAVACGLAAGAYMGRCSHSPASAYTENLNGDDKADIIVEKRNGKKVVFLQQEDGSYLVPQQVIVNARDSVKRLVDSLESQLNKIKP